MAPSPVEPTRGPIGWGRAGIILQMVWYFLLDYLEYLGSPKINIIVFGAQGFENPEIIEMRGSRILIQPNQKL